jgi:hypothetical protein
MTLGENFNVNYLLALPFLQSPAEDWHFCPRDWASKLHMVVRNDSGATSSARENDKRLRPRQGQPRRQPGSAQQDEFWSRAVGDDNAL